MKSLDTVATAALARCEASGACEDPVPAPSPPRAGERVLEGVAWTGYVDAPITPTGELLGGLTWTATLASLRPAWAAARLRTAQPALGFARATLRCDANDCTVELHADARVLTEAQRAVVLLAEGEGWHVGPSLDLCPAHGEPYEAPRRELYPKGGRP